MFLGVFWLFGVVVCLFLFCSPPPLLPNFNYEERTSDQYRANPAMLKQSKSWVLYRTILMQKRAACLNFLTSGQLWAPTCILLHILELNRAPLTAFRSWLLLKGWPLAMLEYRLPPASEVVSRVVFVKVSNGLRALARQGSGAEAGKSHLSERIFEVVNGVVEPGPPASKFSVLKDSLLFYLIKNV